jgi:hypothetical protein
MHWQLGGIVDLGYQLTDGVQTVDGLVVERVEGLRVHPGLKVSSLSPFSS